MAVEIGRLLVIVGVSVLALGALLWVSGGQLKPYPLGQLPGDLVIRGERFTLYLPLMTSVLLSVLITATLWGLGHLGR